METFSKANRHFHLTTYKCYTYNLLAIASLLFAPLSCAFALKLAGWGPHWGTTSPSSSNKTSSKSSLLKMQMLCSTHAAKTVVTTVWMFHWSICCSLLNLPFSRPKARSIVLRMLACVSLNLLCAIVKWPLSRKGDNTQFKLGYAESARMSPLPHWPGPSSNMGEWRKILASWTFPGQPQ